MMPRRQTREIPRWRRGKTPAFAPQPQVVQIRGRKAIELMRQMEAQQAGQAGRAPNPAAATNDMLARTGAWRRRRQMPPVAWGVGLAVIGEILHNTHNPVLFGIIGGLIAAALLILFTRHLSVYGRRWFDFAAFLSLGWLPALAAFGFGSPVPALLAITVVGASGAWIKHYRARPQAQPEPEPEMGADQVIWERLAAARNWVGQLGPVEQLPGGGRRYPIQLDGIKTTIGNVVSASENVAGAWHKPMTEAYAERDPHGITSRGYLTILGSETLTGVREWNGAGMDPQTGMAAIGRYADGTDLHIKLYTPRYGTRHGLISGTTGSGKSQTLDLLIHVALKSGVFVPVVLDPQEGQSLPFWKSRVLYASGTAECHRMLRGLHAGMLDRSRYLADLEWDDDGIPMHGLNFFDYELTGLPMPLIIFDEAHMALKGRNREEREIIEMVTEIGRLGRKTGTALWLATHLPSLSELGGEQALRDMLRGGNVVSMRTANRVSGGMVGLEKDPSEIPRFFQDGKETYGLGYADGPDARPDAPMRTDLVPKAMRRNLPPVRTLDDRFLEAMDRAMRAGEMVLPSAPAAAQPAAPADDGPDGRRCIDAVWTVLKREAREMERGEIIEEVGKLATGEWGRDKQFSLRSFTNALSDLAGGKDPARPVIKPRDGVYEALAPRGEAPIADSNDTTER
jgi:uncharacterized protein DUF87